MDGWMDGCGMWYVVCGECCVLQANLLKPDLCELSNYRDEPHAIFDAEPFFEERPLVRVE
jgi:hypothetical protein